MPPIISKKRTHSLLSMVHNTMRLMGMIARQRPGLLLALFAAFVAMAAVPFAQSGSRGLLVNELVHVTGLGTMSARLLVIMVFMVASLTLPATLFSVVNYLTRTFRFYLQERFEILLIEKRSQLDVATLEDPANNDLFNKISENGVWRIENAAERPFYLLQNILEAIIASVILAVSQWWVFLIILVLTLPEFIIGARHGERVWSIHTGDAESRRKYWHYHQQFIGLQSLIELKLFQNTRYFIKLVRELYHNFLTKQYRAERRRLLLDLLVLFFSQLGIAFAAVWFVFAVVRGEMLVGTLIFVIAAIGDLRQSLGGFFKNLGTQYEDNLYITDTFTLLDMKPRVVSPARSIALPATATPIIEFQDVSFKYPTATDNSLEHVSFTINPGEKAALVGANGSGKTTLVKLLCRFYDPTAGRILINGTDLRELDLESWYATLGVLFQEYARYYFPVAEAIALGDTSRRLSTADAIAAAADSESMAFIERWPKKYKQPLGNSFNEGVEPSVGQWQKLALARSFYRQPRIYILDEPTAAIDAQAEAAIFERLEKLPKDISTILISHRFSTVRHADKIIVLNNGNLEEIGSHDQLIAQKGTYAELFRLQAKEYK